jgi:hypothetical protein
VSIQRRVGSYFRRVLNFLSAHWHDEVSW